MTEKITAFVTGRVYWFKGLGEPKMNEFAGERQWSFDLEASPSVIAFLKENNLMDKLKKTQDGTIKLTPDGSQYIGFKRSELFGDGVKNSPWRIVDKDGAPWDSSTLIGNGSVARVKVEAKAFTKAGRTLWGLYAQAIQIGELVEFVSNEFPAWDAESKPTADSTPAKAKKSAAKADPIDDDDPFA